MRDAAAYDDVHEPRRSPAARGHAGAPELGGASRVTAVAGRGKGRPKGGPLASAAIAAQRLGGRRAAARAAASRLPAGPVSHAIRQVLRIGPFKIVTAGIFGLSLVGIVANAMVFQTGHHPAPLFGSGQAAGPAKAPDGPAKVAATLPASFISPERTGTVPPPAVDAASPVPAPARPAMRSETAKGASPRHPAGRPAAAKAGTPDGIAKLLQAGRAPASAGPEAAASKPDAALRAAQRQLALLGYRVKADGLMSAETRRAMGKFEHDHHVKAGAALTTELRHDIATAAADATAPAAAAEPPAKAR